MTHINVVSKHMLFFYVFFAKVFTSEAVFTLVNFLWELYMKREKSDVQLNIDESCILCISKIGIILNDFVLVFNYEKTFT